MVPDQSVEPHQVVGVGQLAAVFALERLVVVALEIQIAPVLRRQRARVGEATERGQRVEMGQCAGTRQGRIVGEPVGDCRVVVAAVNRRFGGAAQARHARPVRIGDDEVGHLGELQPRIKVLIAQPLDNLCRQRVVRFLRLFSRLGPRVFVCRLEGFFDDREFARNGFRRMRQRGICAAKSKRQDQE